MKEPIAVVVPKELYYHEVAYVRGPEARAAELEAALTECDEELELLDQGPWVVALRARITTLRARITVIKDAPQ